MDFKGLIRFSGTKADYDKLDKTGKLVFAQITNFANQVNVAPYYLYAANGKEFALNSYDQFKELANKITGATGDKWLAVNSSGSLKITHKNSGVAAGSYNGSISATNNKTVEITVPTFTVDGAGHLTAAGTTSTTISPGSFGLGNALHFVGATTSKPTSTTGHADGDVIIVTGTGEDADKEFVATGVDTTGATWIELGDESSYAKKTVQITAETGLAGGGTLGSSEIKIGLGSTAANAVLLARSAVQGIKSGNEAIVTLGDVNKPNNITISHKAYGSTAAAAAVKVGRDGFGHVIIGGTLNAGDITLSDVAGLDLPKGSENVQGGFEVVLTKINAVDSKTYKVQGQSYITASSSKSGSVTTFTVGASLATVPSVAGITGATAATATGIATDAYVKDYVTTALAWSVIGQ